MARCGILSLATIVAVLTIAGCGPQGPPRYRFAGKITYQGKPIPAGIVWFDPDLKAGVDGPQGFAVIKDGKYDTSLDGGQGPVGGKTVLRVYGHDGIPAPELAMGKPLFPGATLSKDLPQADTENFDIDVPLQVPGRGKEVIP